jgi:glycosyltransferase involved in cell wall biosynthesis
VPCIGTIIGGIPEVIRDGYNGYLVSLGDVKTVAEKALHVFANPGLHAELSAHAQQTVHRKFYSKNILKQYEKIYDQLINEVDGHATAISNSTPDLKNS